MSGTAIHERISILRLNLVSLGGLHLRVEVLHMLFLTIVGWHWVYRCIVVLVLLWVLWYHDIILWRLLVLLMPHVVGVILCHVRLVWLWCILVWLDDVC